jgi:hypothetical protein
MTQTSVSPAGSTVVDDETPPKCPLCHRRLVMLAMHWVKDERGASMRRQLWGCPRGHATAYRARGRFSPIELLESFND